MLFFVIFSVLIVMPVASQLNFITVVTTGFLINVIELGTFKSFGVLLLSIADSLEATNATLGFTISLCMSIGYIFGKMSCFLWIISSGIHRNVRVQVFIVANSKEEIYIQTVSTSDRMSFSMVYDRWSSRPDDVTRCGWWRSLDQLIVQVTKFVGPLPRPSPCPC